MNNIIEKFKNDKLAVNCQAEEQAERFIKICYENGIEWYCGNVNMTSFDEYKERTSYVYNYGNIPALGFANREFYLDEGYKVITFDEFMREYKKMKPFTKDDLKVGMLVEYRNGSLRIVMQRADGELYLMGECNFSRLESYNNELTHKLDNNFDIIKVYGLEEIYGSASDLFDLSNRELLWQREEAKELTVDEISKLLGYKVKVIGND